MQRSNLPEPLTSFVGRERELVEIKRLFAGTRLLTLVGVGGIGKTRLALEVAVEMVDAYRDGVWFVDLAPLVDPTLVPSSVAQALGVSESAGTPLIDTLCSQVKSRQLLLLLDNCEHVLRRVCAACRRDAAAAAGVTILATSREPLQRPGRADLPACRRCRCLIPVRATPESCRAIRSGATVRRAGAADRDFASPTRTCHAVAQSASTSTAFPLAHRAGGRACPIPDD